MRNNPCNGCEKEDGREVGCHSWCFKYIKWKKKNDKSNKNKRKSDEYEGYISDLTRTGRL